MSGSTGSRIYLVESFAGSAGESAVAEARDRLRAACADLRATGTAVDYLGALLVPQDELILHLFASPEADGVRDASRRAAIRVERVVESVAMGLPPDGTLVVPARPGGVTARELPTRRG
jgi:hypothetical protein